MRIANTFEHEQGDDKQKRIEGSLENGQLTNFYFRTLIELQLALAIIVIVNFLLIVVSAEYSFPKLDSVNQTTFITCLYFSCACLLLQILLVCMRAITVLKLQKQQKIIYQKATLFSTAKLIYLLSQIFIMTLQPYPFFQGQQFQTINSYKQQTIMFPINDLLTILSVGRLYVVFRTALQLTPYMTNRSNRLCKMYGCRADFSFSLKCLFKDNPLTLICILFASSALLFAYLVYVAERQLGVQNGVGYKQAVCNNYANALWLILITITTVGYGDYVPQTPLGRIIIMFVAVWGTFIVSIMVVVVSNTLNMEKNQLRSNKILNKLHLKQQLNQLAGNFIGQAFLYHKRRTPLSLRFLFIAQQKFSVKNKQIKQIAEYDDIQDQVASRFLILNNDIDILNSNQNKLIKFIHQSFNYKPSEPKEQIQQDLSNSDIDENSESQLNQKHQKYS